MGAFHPDRGRAPCDQQHDHHGGDVHDPQRFLARFGNALDVLPPEIESHQNREEGRCRIHGKDDGGVRVAEQFVNQTGKIETRRYAADRTCQDVVEHERRHRHLGERRSHGFLDDAIHAAADKHAAALDVDRSDRVGQHHDRQDEPWSRFPNEVLRDGARVERGRTHVIEHDGGGAPERDEREHRRRGDQHPLRPGRGWSRLNCRGGRVGRFRHTAPERHAPRSCALRIACGVS